MENKYSRQQLDDIGKRNINKNSFRARVLDRKRTTIDGYTGEKLYTHKRYSSNTQLNIDHIMPIDVARERYSGYLNASELREILVDDCNLVATNEKLNKSKGGKTNLQYVLDNWDNAELDLKTQANMIFLGTKAEVGVNINVAQKVITKELDNFSEEIFLPKNELDITLQEGSSAKSMKGKDQNNLKNEQLEFMLYSFALGASKTLYRSYNGELSREEAIKEIYTDTGIMIGAVAFEEMIIQLEKTLETDILSKTAAFASSQAALTVVNSSINIIRYVNSDIDGYQCVNNLIFDFIKTPAFIFSAAIGGPIAGLLTTSIISEIQTSIGLWLYEWQQSKKLTALQISRYNRLLEDFNRKIDYDRSLIETYIEKKNQEFDSLVLNGYYSLCKSISENNFNHVTISLNQIMKYFDKEVLFSDINSFDMFFFDDNKTLTI